MFPQVALLELLRFCTLTVFKWLSRENRRYESLLISKVNALDLPQKVDSIPLFYRLPNTLDSRKKNSRSSVIVIKTLTLLFNKDKSMLSSARERSAMPKSRPSFGIRVGGSLRSNRPKPCALSIQPLNRRSSLRVPTKATNPLFPLTTSRPFQSSDCSLLMPISTRPSRFKSPKPSTKIDASCKRPSP